MTMSPVPIDENGTKRRQLLQMELLRVLETVKDQQTSRTHTLDRLKRSPKYGRIQEDKNVDVPLYDADESDAGDVVLKPPANSDAAIGQLTARERKRLRRRERRERRRRRRMRVREEAVSISKSMERDVHQRAPPRPRLPTLSTLRHRAALNVYEESVAIKKYAQASLNASQSLPASARAKNSELGVRRSTFPVLGDRGVPSKHTDFQNWFSSLPQINEIGTDNPKRFPYVNGMKSPTGSQLSKEKFKIFQAQRFRYVKAIIKSPKGKQKFAPPPRKPPSFPKPFPKSLRPLPGDTAVRYFEELD